MKIPMLETQTTAKTYSSDETVNAPASAAEGAGSQADTGAMSALGPGSPQSDRISQERSRHVDALICRTCGCSLVRLGIPKDTAPAYEYSGEQHRFCCRACVDLFKTDAQRYLKETSDLIVCPTCLAEKPRSSATAVIVNGDEVHLCLCPHCMELFKRNPDFYLGRLAGAIPNEGVRDHEGCCVRPEQE